MGRESEGCDRREDRVTVPGLLQYCSHAPPRLAIGKRHQDLRSGNDGGRSRTFSPRGPVAEMSTRALDILRLERCADWAVPQLVTPLPCSKDRAVNLQNLATSATGANINLFPQGVGFSAPNRVVGWCQSEPIPQKPLMPVSHQPPETLTRLSTSVGLPCPIFHFVTEASNLMAARFRTLRSVPLNAANTPKARGHANHHAHRHRR